MLRRTVSLSLRQGRLTILFTILILAMLFPSSVYGRVSRGRYGTRKGNVQLDNDKRGSPLIYKSRSGLREVEMSSQDIPRNKLIFPSIKKRNLFDITNGFSYGLSYRRLMTVVRSELRLWIQESFALALHPIYHILPSSKFHSGFNGCLLLTVLQVAYFLFQNHLSPRSRFIKTVAGKYHRQYRF